MLNKNSNSIVNIDDLSESISSRKSELDIEDVINDDNVMFDDIEDVIFNDDFFDNNPLRNGSVINVSPINELIISGIGLSSNESLNDIKDEERSDSGFFIDFETSFYSQFCTKFSQNINSVFFKLI